MPGKKLLTENQILTLNDGFAIPQLGFGTWRLKGIEAYDAVRAALELGYRHIDTAVVYENETEVGKAIQDSGIPRAEITLVTKVWNDMHLRAEASLAGSLARLGLDYVDVLLIHWPVAGRSDYLKAWEDMQTFRADGRVKAIGVCNFMPEDLENLITKTGVKPVMNQIEIHPSFTQVAAVAANTKYGITTESWTPLGKGADLELPEIQKIAATHGVTAGQVVLRWHLQHGYVVIPKTKTPARMLENADIFGFQLSAAEMQIIDGLDAGNRTGPNPYTYTGDPSTR